MNPFLTRTIYSLSLCISMLWLPLSAQEGLHTQVLYQDIHSQTYQPALLYSHTFEHISVGVEGGFLLGANSFDMKGLDLEDNKLTETGKDRILSQLDGENNRLQIGYNWGAHVNFRLNKLPIGLSYHRQNHFFVRVNDSSTAGLLLRGNAPYAGTPLSDEEVRYRELDYHSLGIATAFSSGNWTVGIRLKGLIGRRAEDIDDFTYTLLTATDGTQLDLNATYNVRTSDGVASGAWGVGADIGAILQLSSNLRAQARINNLGFIRWNEGKTLNQAVDVIYEGYDIGNIIGGGIQQELVLGDTLRTLIFPDTADAAFTTPLPALAAVGVDIDLPNSQRVFVSCTNSI